MTSQPDIPTQLFSQDKLTKSEWDSIEIPENDSEMSILQLIVAGYTNVNICVNSSLSLFTYTKIPYTEQLETHLYLQFLEPIVKKLIIKYRATFLTMTVNTKLIIKTADKIRIEKTTIDKLISANIYEITLLNHIELVLKYFNLNDPKWLLHYYTIYNLKMNNILLLNIHVVALVKKLIERFEDNVNLSHIITNAQTYIEKNTFLLANMDTILYEHQKQIYTVSKNPEPKLILYIAPTGTGKTLTPLGLSEQHRIIFVCAARHVGLALGRAAVSMHKRIAFAFGCSSAENVRLHYFSAKEYTKNRHTGGIFKVDNSVGNKVEIMICDIRSYLPAMLYMLAFNDKSDIITYWDEPTITMDYESHEFHEIIKKNWTENLIPNMVLSSATLPKLHELTETIHDFKQKFPNSTIYNIVSHDCRKTIPLINSFGFVEMPHYISSNYDEILQIVAHCNDYLTLLRYLDLTEISRFITFIENSDFVSDRYKISCNFASIEDINMTSVKLYYLKLLSHIEPSKWNAIYSHLMETRSARILQNNKVDIKGLPVRKTQSIGPGIQPTIQSNNMGAQLTRLNSEQHIKIAEIIASPVNGSCGVYVTTKDSHTLTNGPTIFIVNSIDTITRFCIQQANIPSCVMDEIMEKIEFNNKLNTNIYDIEQVILSLTEKNDSVSLDNNGNLQLSGAQKTKTKGRDAANSSSKAVGGENNDVTKLRELNTSLEALRNMFKIISLNETFIPNKNLHVKKWTADTDVPNVFTSDIDEVTVVSIMMLHGISDSWKILLLLGIGVISLHTNKAYTEIMKKLAIQQKLYMIIAESDYIYGTNYQFSHGYLSKDLVLTQEKIIQAIGRIGRNNIQHDYSIRFRDDSKFRQLFMTELVKPEVINMNRLFNSSVA